MKDKPFKNKKIWITGHRGMAGSALVKSFAQEEAKILTTHRKDVDLRDRSAVFAWMKEHRPQMVFHLAAKVGGIRANSLYPADFLSENLSIQNNVIEAAHEADVEKLVFVASNCVYPQDVSQPIAEESLLTGMVESHIRAYAISKIAGIELCRAFNRQHGREFISVIPPNLYGPGDNYDLQNGHIVAGILRRAHEAKITNSDSLVVWGDGTPRREILHVEDLAAGLKYVMLASGEHDLYNVGCGHDLTIAEIAALIKHVVGFNGEIVYDKSKPNGTMRKLLDNRKILSLGWTPRVSEDRGLRETYASFEAAYSGARSELRL